MIPDGAGTSAQHPHARPTAIARVAGAPPSELKGPRSGPGRGIALGIVGRHPDAQHADPDRPDSFERGRGNVPVPRRRGGDGSPARPVILTALAAVLAFIPLTFSAFWGPMAYALVGGTAGGTVLTIVFLPAAYAIWFKIKRPLRGESGVGDTPPLAEEWNAA